jgi:single-stranded-DNA-specific exonuclease
MSVATFNINLGTMPCLKKSLQRLFRTKVYYPRTVELKDQRRKIRIGRKALQAELTQKYDELFVGMTLQEGMLVISELSPDHIEIKQNMSYSTLPENRFLSTAQNLRKKMTNLTHGAPDEAVKELVGGDLITALEILAQDSPVKVKETIANGEFEQVLIRQDRKCLERILHLMSSAILKLEDIFQSERLQDLFPFMPPEAKQEIARHLASGGKIFGIGYCRQINKEVSKLTKSKKEEIHRILAESRTEVLEILEAARSDIENIIGISLEQIRSGSKILSDDVRLKEAISWANRNNLLSVLQSSYVDAIAANISESRRSKIIAAIEKSNLLENVKIPLLHILAEKEYVYVSMFSFTSPLFAAAFLASSLRGANVKILLDRSEAGKSSSQYDDLANQAQALAQAYPNITPLKVRIFSGTQHQKNIILGGSRVIIIGSQNLSERGFTKNLEDIAIIQNDPNFEVKKGEFEEIFGISGRFIPFPEEMQSKHWVARSGLQGIEFPDKTPSPREVASILGFFSRLRTADFRNVRTIFAMASDKGFELAIDLETSFENFLREIKNPVIARALLPHFLYHVPAEFSFAAASWSGRLHPGTTTGFAGLIEHENIMAEIAIKICKFLDREYLVDEVLLCTIAHDTYKNAWTDSKGNLTWGRYNPSHGQLAAQRLEETYMGLEQKHQAAIPAINDVLQSVEEHMSVFNKPESTPLVPKDPVLKYIIVMADMLSSRKYFYVKHRARLPLEREEVLHLLLNNSFSIEGEALSRIQEDEQLFAFITEAAQKTGHKIEAYADLPRRAKKMLRVAESLCDLFPPYQEVMNKKGKEPTEEETERIKNRGEILTAALLYGTLRYKYGIDEPRSRRVFNGQMRRLRKMFADPASREKRILDLMIATDKKLSSPHHAGLSPKDSAELWIMCMANCMMVAEDTWIVTVDEVEQYLSKAEEPKTTWVRRKFNGKTERDLAAGINTLALTEHLDEILPVVEEGLLTRLNFRRKKPLQQIDREILLALIDKYGSLFPSYIYEHFYRPLSSYHRKKMIEKIRTAAQARDELIEEINNLAVPDKESPAQVYKMSAQTALINRMNSIGELKAGAIDPARDLLSIAEYGYFKQIHTAAQHVFEKIKDPEEKILIYGDYDVDGLTATALLVKTLRWIRAKMLSQKMDRKEAQRIAHESIGYYIPHRLNEGYSLNSQAMVIIHRRGFRTVITADCGTRDRELVKHAKELGIDIVVTDHHEVEKKDLPQDAVAVLNPKLDLDQKHPAYNLPGAAVAYKLAKALADKAGMDLGDSFLDSVALAAVADVVPMLGENRAFVKAGLERLNSVKRNKGLSAIIKAFRLEYVDEEALAFFLAPILNVVGRFGNAYEGLKLLMAFNEKQARRQVSSMFSYLDDRREIEQAILSEAEDTLQFDPDKDSGIAVSGEWHKGIIGIVASKLVNKYGVPSVTIGTAHPSSFSEEEPAYGSMRSIKGISAIKILNLCARQYKTETGEDLFLSFGGHVGAAGFKIRKERIPDLKKIYGQVTKAAVKSKREKMTIAGTLREGEISLEEVKLFRQILSPFGSGFEEPRFYVPATIKSWQVFGRDQQHIRGFLEGGTTFVFFNGNQPWVKRVLMQKKVRFVAKLGINRYKGRENVNLIIEDLKSFKKRA